MVYRWYIDGVSMVFRIISTYFTSLPETRFVIDRVGSTPRSCASTKSEFYGADKKAEALGLVRAAAAR